MSWAAFIASAAASTLLAAVVVTGRGSERRSACPGSLMPAYLPPRAIIDFASHARLPWLLIVNPASGPGTAPHPPYRDAVRAAQAAGARVLGYIPTAYAARPRASVEADIDRYATWYGVDGVFLDEAAHTEAQLDYYRALGRRALTAGVPLVALNPGVVPARGYFDVADVVVTFEGPFADFAARLAAMPRWLREVPAKRIAHLVYGASRAQALEAIAARGDTGYLYVTSGTPPDPWSTLPSYLTEEQDALGGCA
jgi:hypothetical protein